MLKFFFHTLIIFTVTIVIASPAEINNGTSLKEKQITANARFINIEHIFENEYYLIFKTMKGSTVKLYVSFPDEKVENFSFLVEKNDRIVANSKLKNKEYIIKYTQKHEVDENTGAPRTRNYIDSIDIKK